MIYIITHKRMDDSKVDHSIYKVLYVGSGTDCQSYYLRDNTGINIANKNTSYCELTGLYWIWKNGSEKATDITGLVHYRRFFTTNDGYKKYKDNGQAPNVLSTNSIINACDENTVIMPKSYHTLSTLYDSYKRCHNIEDIRSVRSVIKVMYPEYLKTFDKVMNGHKGYYFNMIICQKRVLDEYCSWLFPLLFEIEKQIDLNKYENQYQKRVFGFIAERLIQVWVIKNNYSILEYPVFNTTDRPIGYIQRNFNRIKWLRNKILSHNK